jgi:alkaline phosphatase
MYGNISVNNPEDDLQGIFLSGNHEQSGSIIVHALQDVGIFATGPGSERVMGIVDNTEVYHMRSVLALTAWSRGLRMSPNACSA